MAEHPLSYLALTDKQKIFVLEYIRQGCDPLKTVRSLYPHLSDESSRVKSSKLMADPAITEAITDKLDQRLMKHDTSRDAMTTRLFSLIDDVAALPESKQRISHLKFILDVYSQIAKISGLNHTRHTHDHNHRSIVINVGDVNEQGETIEIPAHEVNQELPPSDPGQLAISFPSSDPVVYSMDELLRDDDEEGSSPSIDASSEADPE